MTPLIDAHHLRKEYRLPGRADGVIALADVSCTVANGEFVAIMGPSGGGKSTLLHLIGAMDVPSGGDLWLDGSNTAGMSDRALTRLRRAKVGFVFQFFNLMPTLSAVENVELPLLLLGEHPKHARIRATEALASVALADRLQHRPNELSGGQMQRVAIARAIVHQPALLLADEPTGNLDSQTGTQILKLLHELHARGQTIVMATHSPEAAALAGRTLLLRDGRVVDG